MKLATKIGISVLPLLFISLTSDPYGNRAHAATDQCDRIREVRRLAIRENLDNENLATLENRYCSGRGQISSITLPPRTATQDCIDLMAMMQLAAVSEGRNQLVTTIENQQRVSCATSKPENRASFNWSNGQTAKSKDTWYYPNGQAAKLGNSRYYPNGKTAKLGETWYYPNGQTAKLGETWYYPNGNSSDVDGLVSRTCSILGENECRQKWAEVQTSNYFWQDLTLIDLSWNAYNNNRNNEGR